MFDTIKINFLKLCGLFSLLRCTDSYCQLFMDKLVVYFIRFNCAYMWCAKCLLIFIILFHLCFCTLPPRGLGCFRYNKLMQYIIRMYRFRLDLKIERHRFVSLLGDLLLNVYKHIPKQVNKQALERNHQIFFHANFYLTNASIKLFFVMLNPLLCICLRFCFSWLISFVNVLYMIIRMLVEKL